MEEQIRLTAGGVGLEGRLAVPPAGVSAVTIICHPHPLFGGTMDNPVVLALRDAAAESGAATVRFNFRGVGASEGRAGSEPEAREDLRAVVAFARREFPTAPLWVAGYSFGAVVAAAVVGEDKCAERAVLVAPPLALDRNLALPRSCPTLLVVGDDDRFCPASMAREAAEISGADIVVISDCDHFFGDRAGELRTAVREWLGQAQPV